MDDPETPGPGPLLPRGMLDRMRLGISWDTYRRIAEAAAGRGWIGNAPLAELLQEYESAFTESALADGGRLVERGLLSLERFLELRKEIEEGDLSPFLTGIVSPLPPEVAQVQALPERRFGHFLLVHKIGAGAMGTLWKSWDRKLGRWVAVKVLREDSPEEVRRRFLRETRVIASLRHPNLVALHDAGEQDGRPYLVMELIEGHPWRPDRPLRESIGILRKAAQALDEAHRRGVIHRDLKPGNLLIDAHGEPCIVDFGLAHLMDSPLTLTRTGSPLGTPQYMAPEQVRGRADLLGPATDVYALGMILYEAMTGRPPFAAPTIAEMFESILHKEIPAPTGPRDLVTICRKALEKDPSRRYATARDFADELSRFLEGEPVRARPPGFVRRFRTRLAGRPLLAVSGVSALLLAFAAWLVLGLARERTHLRDLRNRLRPFDDLILQTRKDFYIRTQDIAASLRDVEEALDPLQTLTEEADFARFPEAWTALGIGWYLAGDSRRSERMLARADELGSADPWVDFFRGRIYLDRMLLSWTNESGVTSEERRRTTGEWGRKAAERFQSLPPEWKGAGKVERHVIRAYLAIAAEDLTKVEEICRDGLEQFRLSVGAEEYWNLLGWVEQLRGNHARAVEHYTSALQIRAHYAWAYLVRAAAAAAQNTDPARQQALEDCEAALRINRWFVEAYEMRGNLWKNRGDAERARADYDRAVEIDPDYARAWYKRGVLRSERGETEAAIADFTEAIRRDPRYVRAYNNRADALLRSGKIEEAVADCTSAISINPDYPVAYVTRAEAHAAAGRTEAAFDDLAQARRCTPPDDERLLRDAETLERKLRK